MSSLAHKPVKTLAQIQKEQLLKRYAEMRKKQMELVASGNGDLVSLEFIQVSTRLRFHYHVCDMELERAEEVL